MPQPHRSARATPPLALFAAAVLAAVPLPAMSGAKGVADPSVSWNLTSVTDWDSGPVFLNIAHSMRGFFAYAEEWSTLDNDALRAGNYLDDAGYATSIPEGQRGIRTIWAWNPELGGSARAGVYVFTYAGRGNITVQGDATIIQQRPGQIVFENSTGGAFWIDISAIDKGNHPRDFVIVRADKLALHEAGAVFDPAWLSLVADAREIRFMDWMRTNDALPPAFADRPLPQDATYAEDGVPLELMVRLANEAGVDPWFTMRHDADDATIRAYATYVRDMLDPRLKAHVEYSNETWNAAFTQFRWLRDRAVADWGDAAQDDWEIIFDYHVRQAARTAMIWRDVFGAQADTRLVTVLGTQAGNAWLTGRQMTAESWQRFEPDTYTPPAALFDEVAATTYFGGSVVSDDALRGELRERASISQLDAETWLFDLMSQPDTIEDSIPAVMARLAEQKAVAASAGLRFTAYEGGQHVHHSFAVNGLADEEADALAAVLGTFVRSRDMGALYARLWDGWRAIGDGPFMQFSEMGAPTRWGSWGLVAHAGDRTPRAEFILARQVEGGSWWGEGGGPQYLHGVTASGTESADAMDGTDEEDFLAGLGGDDSFAESGGRDGINGGEGTDTLRLAGPRGDYTVTPEGAGQRITGPRGSIYAVNVETLSFTGGETLVLSGP